MTMFRKFGIFATTGILGFAGFQNLISSHKAICLPLEGGGGTLQKAISDSQRILSDLQKKSSIPGLTIAVSVDGNIVWKEGFGYRDVENKIPCTPETVMKIASISKCITSTILAKEMELGRLNLDENISKYILDWPQKLWLDEKVEITPRQLACHMAGIRGYKPIENKDVPPAFRYEEYFLTKKFKSVQEALKLFQNDPLIYKPGDKFAYSNHGYTLLSYVLEKTSNEKFPQLLSDLFRKCGMKNSFIDDPHKVIYERSRQYSIKDSVVLNAPHVDSSFKIAGAGLLSSAVDLVQFANVLLSSYYLTDDASEHAKTISMESLPPSKRFLKKESIEMLWKPIDKTHVSWHDDGKYGLGWQMVESDDKLYVGHTGRSVGVSTVLLISLPTKRHGIPKTERPPVLPKAAQDAESDPSVVVAILANLEGVSLGPVGIRIANIFESHSRGQG